MVCHLLIQITRKCNAILYPSNHHLYAVLISNGGRTQDTHSTFRRWYAVIALECLSDLSWGFLELWYNQGCFSLSA